MVPSTNASQGLPNIPRHRAINHTTPSIKVHPFPSKAGSITRGDAELDLHKPGQKGHVKEQHVLFLLRQMAVKLASVYDSVSERQLSKPIILKDDECCICLEAPKYELAIKARTP